MSGNACTLLLRVWKRFGAWRWSALPPFYAVTVLCPCDWLIPFSPKKDFYHKTYTAVALIILIKLMSGLDRWGKSRPWAFVAGLVTVYQILQNCWSFQEKYFIHKYRDNKCEQLIRTEQLKYCRGQCICKLVRLNLGKAGFWSDMTLKIMPSLD